MSWFRSRLSWAGLLAAAVAVAGACSDDAAAPVDAATIEGAGTALADFDWPDPGTATAGGRTPLDGFAEVEVRVVEGPDGEPVVLCVLVAETPEQRARGLMEVTDLGGYDGMIFVYDTEVENGFWMRDTPMPLSIAHLDAAGEVVGTVDMEPCLDAGPDCPRYPPAAPFRFALEVPQGDLDAVGVVVGARLEVTGACAPAT